MRSMYDLTQEYLGLFNYALENESGDLDIDSLLDEIEDKIQGVAYVIKRLKAEAKLIDDEAERLWQRKRRIEANAERLKDKLIVFMLETGKEKVKKPDITVYLGNPPPKVAIDDEKLIPEIYLKVIKTPYRTEIKKALLEGIDIPGTRLEQSGRTLNIR